MLKRQKGQKKKHKGLKSHGCGQSVCGVSKTERARRPADLKYVSEFGLCEFVSVQFFEYAWQAGNSSGEVTCVDPHGCAKDTKTHKIL